MHEPSDSDISTGITLFGQYMHKTYQYTQSSVVLSYGGG
jgi:hypothetical protein